MTASAKLGAALCITLAAIAFIAAGCSSTQPKLRAERNQAASLTGDLPANPLAWQVVTSSIDKNKSEMSTLYGNDAAIAYARSHSDHNYPAGAILGFVTWMQTDDPRYFGAKIPGKPKSVEFVTVIASADGHPSYLYQLYEGAPLQKSSQQQTTVPADRAAFILSLRSAVFP